MSFLGAVSPVTPDPHLHATLRSLSEAVIAADLAGRVTLINPPAERITGWTATEALGRSLSEVFRLSHPSGQAVTYFKRSMTGPDRSSTILLTTRQGELVPIEDNTAPIRDEDGSLVGMVTLFRLAQPSAVSATAIAPTPVTPPRTDLLETVTDPFFCVDGQWRFTFVNEPAATSFGAERQALVGRSLWDELPGILRQKYYAAFSAALAHKERKSLEMHDTDANTWWEANLYPFQDGLLVLLRDITQRKIGDEEAARQDRLESLGLLARGFAHDFNNLLTVQMGGLSLLNLKLPDEPSVRQDLETVRTAAEKAQQLVQNLLTFAKGGAPVKRRLRLGPWLDDLLSGWKPLPHCQLKLVISPETSDLDADPAQLRRLLFCLLRNAEQAIPTDQSGEIIVRAWTQPRLAGDTVDDPMAVIEITDNGVGIPATALPHIYEPYFTTRSDENASGLGLAVAESIVKSHAGRMDVLSAPGRTVFTVFLPAVMGQTTPVPLPTAPLAMGPQTVLVLEDEPLIRRLVTANLSQNGFHVTATADGVETVQRYRDALETGHPFDVVLLDLTIPGGQGGRETMEQLRQLHPGVKAIVSSGYSDDALMSRYLDFGFRAVLPKPYDPSDLVALVREVGQGA
jgi:two-component system, cell cycle sensor histidine kinase and response regulator CckA